MACHRPACACRRVFCYHWKMTKKKPEKKKNGRPSAFRDHFPELVRVYAMLGMTDREMSEKLGVSEQTFNTWKKNKPGFLESLNAGKAPADATVAAKLFERACGYSHPHTDIKVIDNGIVKTEITKHYPPDTTAIIFWLKNRRPDLWRDKPAEEKTEDVADALMSLIKGLPGA